MASRQALAGSATQFILRDNGPAFLGIKRALIARIGREWKVGDRLPPISELARTMGVGQNNAHRAVRELALEGVLFSRRGLGLYVRQLPQAPPVRGIHSDAPLHGKTIGLVVFRETPPPFVHQMIDGFREAIADAGADTRVIAPTETLSAQSHASGLWASVLFNPEREYAAPPGKQNITVVSTAGNFNPDLLSRFDSVSVDQYHGGSLAGHILREVGCKRVCFLGRRIALNTPRYEATSSARLDGFECTWGAHLDENDLLYAPGYSIHAGGLRFATYMTMSPRPDGVFAASDDLALGFVAAAASHGLMAGQDFQLVGFDGQDGPIPGVTGMTLTTVRVPAREMGRRAAQLMIQRAAEPSRPVQRVLLSCSLSRGDTTRA